MRTSLPPTVLSFVLSLTAILSAGFTQPTPTPNADLNNDGYVDLEDLFLFQQQWHKRMQSPSEITITFRGGVTMEMVRIPAGSFVMGSTDDSSWSYCHPCEQPVHEVNIDYDFFMGKYEITQAQWLAVMGNWPATAPISDYGLGDYHPAYDISWEDCQNFVTALNQLGQGSFRLPSEAEWEYACRAGTTTRFYFGDSDCSPLECDQCDLNNYAWWCGNNSPFGTKPVGGKWPNALGLHDMHGNVWEWCQDYWHEGYDGAPPDGSTWESPTSIYRVLRGGAWDANARNCRSSARNGSHPGNRNTNIGFRVVRTP